ncbi:MAG: type II toxin-antitoxin system VapC family toxin [Actinomycetota bacterium]
MLAYVDSSALTKRVLDEVESSFLRDSLRAFSSETGNSLYSSALAWVEVGRAIRAYPLAIEPFLEIDYFDQALSGVSSYEISDEVISLARRIAGPTLRSLDAIHLATATLIDADLVVAYDERLIRSANELGFVTRSPGR